MTHLQQLELGSVLLRLGQWVRLSFPTGRSVEDEQCVGVLKDIEDLGKGSAGKRYRLTVFDINKLRHRQFGAAAAAKKLATFRAMAVLGATRSGKTCLLTALIRYINKELAKNTSLRMALRCGDPETAEYYGQRESELFRKKQVLAATDLQTSPEPPPLMRISLKFKVPGGTFSRGNVDRAVSLLVPDAAGEHYIKNDNEFLRSYGSYADAFILVVDPFASEKFQEERRKAGRPLPEDVESLVPARVPLEHLVTAVRDRLGVPEEQSIPRELAVVVTKCDEPDVFDPDRAPYNFPVQGRKYSLDLATEISERVKQYLEETLDWPDLVALAESSFRNVSFFAASSFGQTPRTEINENGSVAQKLVGPVVPRRVEDFLLWILHKWELL